MRRRSSGNDGVRGVGRERRAGDGSLVVSKHRVNVNEFNREPVVVPAHVHRVEPIGDVRIGEALGKTNRSADPGIEDWVVVMLVIHQQHYVMRHALMNRQQIVH